MTYFSFFLSVLLPFIYSGSVFFARTERIYRVRIKSGPTAGFDLLVLITGAPQPIYLVRSGAELNKRYGQVAAGYIAVSYTHLDVYKRQVCGRECKNP